MIASTLTSIKSQVPRIARAARLADLALRIGESPVKVLNRRWRAAMDIVHFELIPPRIRTNLRALCDVGANRGDWTSAMLELAAPDVVVAFEPIPQVFAQLAARFAGRPTVRCVQAAVGASSKEIVIEVHEQTELSSVRSLSQRGRLAHRVNVDARKLPVPMVTLDDQLKDLDQISLMKFDVQGYEGDVVMGARKTLTRCQCLVTEVLYERDYYAEALSFLELARLIEDVSPLRLSCVSEPSLSVDGMGAWADAVFVVPGC